jgi:hypothetical protein
LTIDNQCFNIELASPIHFTKDATCYIQLPQQVDPNSKAKVKFKTGINRDTFGGVLLYNMQRKECASINTQLLVIWGWKSYRLYSHMYLIEHESIPTWDKDKLEKLHNVYNSWYDIDPGTVEWLLNDNTKLKTKCETSYGGLEMKAIISEEKESYPSQRPLWVNPNR